MVQIISITKKIIISFLFFSCASYQSLEKIKYITYSNNLKREIIYQVKIKNGFKISAISGGNEWTEKSYSYPDNCIFYVSDEKGNTSLNYENIRNNQLMSDKSISASIKNDTITLQGVDSNGNYWKNKYDKEVNMGYKNVSKERKKEFDLYLLNIKRN